MKTLIQISIFLFSTLFWVNLHAQTNYFTIKESEIFKDDNSKMEVVAVHTGDQGKTTVARMLTPSFLDSSPKKKIIFETFDDQAKKILDKTIAIEKKETFYEEMFYGNELKIFTLYTPNYKTRVVYCHILNIETGKHRKVKLFSEAANNKTLKIGATNVVKPNFAVSPNEKYLAVATDHITKYNSYSIRVFDAQTLEFIFKEKYYEEKDKYFKLEDIIVDDQGTVFTLGTDNSSFIFKKKLSGKASYEFVLYKVNQTEKLVERIQLNDDEHIKTLKIVNENNQFQLVGFYSEKNVRRLKGVVSIKINPSDISIEEKKDIPFPIEVFENMFGAKKARNKKKKELVNFNLNHVLEDNSGNSYLLAEEFYVTYPQYSDGNGGMTTGPPQYHYDDIIILKMSKEGELVWGRSIFKRDHRPSYNAFLKDDKLHVLLNSGKDLKEKKDGRVKVKQGAFESMSLYDFIFENDGTVVREKIQDNKGNTFYLPLKGNYKNGKFIMYGSSKRKRQMMILEGK